MSKDPVDWAFDFGCVLLGNFRFDATVRIRYPCRYRGIFPEGVGKTGLGMVQVEKRFTGFLSLSGDGAVCRIPVCVSVVAVGNICFRLNF